MKRGIFVERSHDFTSSGRAYRIGGLLTNQTRLTYMVFLLTLIEIPGVLLIDMLIIDEIRPSSLIRQRLGLALNLHIIPC